MQKPLNISLLVIACFLTITVLVTLQFPSTMSSPWAALSFAVCFTAIIGSVATIVGDEVAPLPLYALIMVTFTSRKLLNSHISIQYKFPHSRFLFLPRSRSCLTPTIYFNWLLDRANVVYLIWIMFRAHTRCFQSHGPCL